VTTAAGNHCTRLIVLAGPPVKVPRFPGFTPGRASLR